MKKIVRISVALICVLLLMATSVYGASAEEVPGISKYDPYTDGIVTAYYTVDPEQGFLRGIAPGTTAEQLQKVCLPSNLTASQEILTTGTVLSAEIPTADPAQAPAIHTLTAIVTGDLNGDGNVTITDMLMLKNKLLGQSLEATAEAAGDINYDGNVTITDFLRIKSVLLGKDRITAGQNSAAAPADPILLLTPGEHL